MATLRSIMGAVSSDSTRAVITLDGVNVRVGGEPPDAGPKQPPGVFVESFQETFDQLAAEAAQGAPRWAGIVIHCHMGARPTLIRAIRKCLAHTRGHDRVWFARKRDIAEWVLQNDFTRDGEAV